MWVLFLENWNGVSLFYEKNFTTSHDIYLHTDAASTAGLQSSVDPWPLDMPGCHAMFGRIQWHSWSCIP